MVCSSLWVIKGKGLPTSGNRKESWLNNGDSTGGPLGKRHNFWSSVSSAPPH